MVALGQRQGWKGSALGLLERLLCDRLQHMSELGTAVLGEQPLAQFQGCALDLICSLARHLDSCVPRHRQIRDDVAGLDGGEQDEPHFSRPNQPGCEQQREYGESDR